MKESIQVSRQLYLTLMIICILIYPSHAQTLSPNPLRAVISEELEAPWEICTDGGFETGEHSMRTCNPYDDSLAILPVCTRTQAASHSGSWSYHVMHTGEDTAEFSVRINPDKAEDIIFSCYIRSAGEPVEIRPHLLFETAQPVWGPVYGPAYHVDSSWTKIELTSSTSIGFRFAHAGIEIPPNTELWIDDMSVKVPVWKEPPSTGTVVGGIHVPAAPAAPVYICFSIHIEDPQNLITSESYFWKKTTVFQELAALFHEHGGFLNIQPEIEWALASERYAPGLLADLASQYNVTYSTHTHGPVCKGPDGTPYGSGYCQAHHQDGNHNTDITESDIARYVQIRKEKFAALSGIPVTDHNGNFDMVHKNLLHQKGIQTLSVFKSKYTQKSYDALYNNPWRPANADALTDLETFLTHDPEGELIYIPGVGSNITKRHERVSLKVQRFAGQFIHHADASRVNAMNLILHVDAFEPADPADDAGYITVQGSGEPVITLSDEFQGHLQSWDTMLTEVIDPLVEAGYLTWGTHGEIAESFMAWEAEDTEAAETDSIVTRVPSEAGAEAGICTLIRLPESARYTSGAPVAVHVAGGFSGSGINGKSKELSNYGFIEIFFNFPGSGSPALKSGGLYDTRGAQSIEALKDIARFAMGYTTDHDGKTLADLCGSVIPLQENTGLVGWSNGGNATLAAAGFYSAELTDLAWILNWESPVGDGMSTAEAGAKGSPPGGNPVTNRAYNADTGEWRLDWLKYDATVNINQHSSSTIKAEMPGGLYFDTDSSGSLNWGTDFVPFPITMLSEDTAKAFYSERITQYAFENTLIPVPMPDHLTTTAACSDFWLLRNGENWIQTIGTAFPHLKFMVVAGVTDHVQTALDHPHVLLQYENLRTSGIAFTRVNPDRTYMEHVLGFETPDCVDNEAGAVFDHLSIRDAVQPNGIPGVNQRTSVAAGCCELADRTAYNNLDPQIETVITGIGSAENRSNAPETLMLSAWPNPFNPGTTISFDIPQPGKVTVRVFDIRGRETAILADGILEAGHHSLNWHAEKSGVSSGVYIILCQTPQEQRSIKILHVK